MLGSTLALLVLSGPAWAGDKDGDGVSNKVDACKTEAEDKDGFEDEDGCPDPDNDKDGILDGDDKCPTDGEDKDGFEDEDGCPDPDNDGDSVLDADDQCPDELENDDTKDGCPTVDYALLADEGFAPAVKSLTELLAANMNDTGCNDAADGAKKWFADHDADLLHKVYQARIARGGDGVDASGVNNVLAAQVGFWTAAKEAMDLYCKDHVLWPTMSPRIDAVYGKVAPK